MAFQKSTSAPASFINKRAIPTSTRSFHEQAKRASAAAQRGGQFKVIEGQWNSFYPRKEKALWFAICPEQSWEFDIYDREAGEVVHLEDQYYFAYVNHRVAASGRNFQCSGGAHKNCPCWGCGIRNYFYDQQRAREEQTGIREKKEAPIGAMVQYAFSGVLLETMAKVEAKDNKGKVRLNRAGQKILKDLPTTLLPLAEAKALKAQGLTTFGLPVHYSCGITHLNALLGFDEDLKNYCASCGDLLFATHMACPDCGTEQELTDEEGNPLQGQAMREARELELSCECGAFKPFLPLVQCTCDNPTEGKLVDFALRLIAEKVGEKQVILKFTEVRPIWMFVEKHPAVADMLAAPLKLTDIFAPTRLENQQYMIPEILRGDGVSPAPKAKKGAPPPAEPYTLSDDDDAADRDD